MNTRWNFFFRSSLGIKISNEFNSSLQCDKIELKHYPHLVNCLWKCNEWFCGFIKVIEVNYDNCATKSQFSFFLQLQTPLLRHVWFSINVDKRSWIIFYDFLPYGVFTPLSIKFYLITMYILCVLELEEVILIGDIFIFLRHILKL